MPTLAGLYSKLSPKLAHKPGTVGPTKAHAWLIRRSGGRLGTRFLGGGELLVLRSIGRRSGEPRDAPMLFVRDGDAYVVCASNAASKRPPAWWLNLQAQPEAEILAERRWVSVRARKATPEETEVLGPRMQATYEGFDHYAAIATREMPFVVLEPR
jgi:deazaflavin-dependent oxidoreductase (nitroreductase family)